MEGEGRTCAVDHLPAEDAALQFKGDNEERRRVVPQSVRSDIICSRQASRNRREEEESAEWVKGYEDVIIVHEQKERIASLQAEIKDLTAEIERLSAAESFLTGSID